MSVLRFWSAAAAVVLIVPPALGQVNIGANFQTIQSSESGFVPPDTTGSVGPNHFMQYNNGRVKMFRKDGSFVSGTSTNEATFWANAGLPTAIANKAGGDPRLQFDPLSGRWYACAFTIESPNVNNSILVGISNTADPTAGWKAVSYQGTGGESLGKFADYPTLAIDRNAVYVGTNNFGGSFNVSLISLPKADLLLSTPSTANISRFDGLVANTVGFTPQGITNFNLGQTNSTGNAIFAISNNSFAQAKYTPVSGTAGPGATLGGTTTLNLATYTANPPAARQPNAGNTAVASATMDTLDDRYGSRVYRVGNRMYGLHWIAATFGTTRAALQLTVLDMSPATPTVLAQTTLGEANFDYYVGSIAANSRGDVVVGYTRSGFIASGNANNRWPSVYVSVGTLSGSTLSFGSPIEVKTGAFYGSTTSGTRRWGDYSATNVDPTDPGIFWTAQEFGLTPSTTQWATQATEVIPTVAGEKRWASINATTPAGITGPFDTAGNWYNGVAPTATDHVIFSRNGNGTASYTVSMTAGSTSVDQASVRQGNVVWSVPSGASFNLTNLGTGASDAAGNVTSAASLAIAEYLGTANLTVSGGGTLNTVTTTIGAGLNSEGSLNASSGSLTITGTGTTWANSQSAYVGGNSTREGGNGALTVSTGAAANIAGNLVVYNRAAGLSANSVTLGTSSTLTASGLTNPGSGTVTPTVALSAASSQLVVSGGSGTTFSGVISGPGSVTKSNAGTFTLTGANTYTGSTTATGGTLALSGSGSVAASPTLTVGTGATLGVSGVTGGANFDTATGQFALATGQTLQGTGTVNDGVTVRPGSGVRGDVGTGTGTLTVAGAAILQGASGTGGATLTTVVSENGTASPAHSTLAAADLNLVIDSVNKFNLVLQTGANPFFVLEQTDTVVVATTTGTVQVNGEPQTAGTVIDPSWYNLTGLGVTLGPTYQLAVDPTGQALALTFTPVPEPATVFALAAAGLGLARRRSRRS